MVERLRRIDHTVVAVCDLDAAGAFHQNLGFQVGHGNHHPWGTENRLIQSINFFADFRTWALEAACPDMSAAQTTAVPPHVRTVLLHYAHLGFSNCNACRDRTRNWAAGSDRQQTENK